MYIEDVFGPTQCHIQIRIDWDTIQKLGLELTILDIRKAIISNKKLKLKRGVCSFLNQVNLRMSVFGITMSLEFI